MKCFWLLLWPLGSPEAETGCKTKRQVSKVGLPRSLKFLVSRKVEDFQQRWRHRYIHFASSHKQKKDYDKFKNKTNQNYQKIELYGSPTTKELKKKLSHRLPGGAESGIWGGEESRQGSGWRTGAGRQWLVDWAVPHLCTDKPGGTAKE